MFCFISGPPSLPVIENSVEIETNKWQLKVTANQKINITCLAQNGKPAADITWAVNGQEVTQNTYYSVADTPGGLKQQDATGMEGICWRDGLVGPVSLVLGEF